METLRAAKLLLAQLLLSVSRLHRSFLVIAITFVRVKGQAYLEFVSWLVIRTPCLCLIDVRHILYNDYQYDI